MIRTALVVPLLAFEVFAGVEVFRAEADGYHTYRIPALIRTSKGTLLAFCEGRKSGRADSGDIDVLLKRSMDGGRTWSAQQVIADLGDDTVGNPAPVVDRKTGTIFLLLTRNPGQVTEKQIVEQSTPATRTVLVMRSSDDGRSWSLPRDITADVKRPEWTWYATGPGNGIQIRSGRLVIPCDHIRAGTKAMHSHVVYSDDRGETWRIGGVAAEKTNESAVAELPDGSLMLNMRSYHGQNRRAVSISRDGGLSWTEPVLDPALIEPVCQASLIRVGKQLFFSNPADTKRVKMTVKRSADGGRTWTTLRVVHQGHSAYSSLAEIGRGRIGLLYERGEAGPYEVIVFERLGY